MRPANMTSPKQDMRYTQNMVPQQASWLAIGESRGAGGQAGSALSLSLSLSAAAGEGPDGTGGRQGPPSLTAGARAACLCLVGGW